MAVKRKARKMKHLLVILRHYDVSYKLDGISRFKRLATCTPNHNKSIVAPNYYGVKLTCNFVISKFTMTNVILIESCST